MMFSPLWSKSVSARTATLLLATAGLWPLHSAFGQEEGGDSPFADADMAPRIQARCSEVGRFTRGKETGLKRVDFSVTGTLALVHHDGTLAYLGLCGTPPDPKVLCVTYQTNGLRVGDQVVVTGGYSKQSADFILLDPCLASQPDQPKE